MSTPTSTLYHTVCRTYVKQADGSEILAEGLAAEVRLRWRDPECVNGVEIDDMECEASDDDLSQICEIKLKDNDDDDDDGKGKGKNSGTDSMAAMEFSLEIAETGMGTRMATAVLEPN